MTTLPPPPAERETASPQADPAAQGLGRRILVVDDDRAFAGTLVADLNRRGFQASSLECGWDVGYLSGFPGDPPEVVLLDLMMPGMDGLDTLRKIKSAPALCGLRVVGLTSCREEARLTTWRSAGLDGLLRKPFELEALCRLLGEVLPSPEAPGSPGGPPEPGIPAPGFRRRQRILFAVFLAGMAGMTGWTLCRRGAGREDGAVRRLAELFPGAGGRAYLSPAPATWEKSDLRWRAEETRASRLGLVFYEGRFLSREELGEPVTLLLAEGERLQGFYQPAKGVLRTCEGYRLLRPEIIASRASATLPYEEYWRRSREARTPGELRALAGWCGDQGLFWPARREWRRVLLLDPGDAEARRRVSGRR